MRILLCLLLLWPLAAHPQSSTVDPSEVELVVEVENAHLPPLAGEMVLLSIHGTYRRHVTLESLEQPDLEGFNWFQLGEDQWYEDIERGKRVKKFRRRMALYANEAGPHRIGPFIHHLTLTDEGDDWFGYDHPSAPLTIDIAPAPLTGDRWFPVRNLRITDDWSNPPDQLRPGEGVFRSIRVEALGASPDMLPAMPELTSPSAMIFAHPEKRLVELSPEGPVSIAFWRWTIQPSNGTSAILEPVTLDYYDIVGRAPYRVTIAAQRIAYDRAAPPAAAPPADKNGRARLWLRSLALSAAFALGCGLTVGRERPSMDALLVRAPILDPLRWRAWAAARRGDAAGLRRAVHKLARRGRIAPDADAMAGLDAVLYGRSGTVRPLDRLLRGLLARRRS